MGPNFVAQNWHSLNLTRGRRAKQVRLRSGLPLWSIVLRWIAPFHMHARSNNVAALASISRALIKVGKVEKAQSVALEALSYARASKFHGGAVILL